MAASSAQTRIGPFDVFISHRGVDMKNGFADCLYRDLQSCGITCFLDKEELPKGHDVRAQMLEAVRTSRIQLPIFTKDYGTSEWCLDELVEMMDCRSKGMSKVCPVFYDVNPVELRTRDGFFARNFEEYTRERKGEHGEVRIKQWEKALREASFLCGFQLQDYGGSTGLLLHAVMQHIREETSEALASHPVTHLVGLDVKVEAVLRGFRLHNQTSVYVVLIFGEGGIGKTTLAREIHRRHRKDFDTTIFVDSCVDENEVSEQLCKDLLREGSVSVGDMYTRRARLIRELSGKKVLIVFDDLNDFWNVENAIDLHSLCPGSLVLVTSRDRTVFPHENEFSSKFKGERYELPMMDDASALQLLCHHAFRRPNPKPGFDKLAMEVVHACAGRPLCLEVLGRCVSSMTTKGQWREVVEKLRDCKHKKVTACLQISFYNLEENEQLMFLDVACFLIGEPEWRVKRFWAASADYWETGLERLKQRCLVKVDDYMRLTMHDHLRDLGRDISKRGKTRVWTDEDLEHLLKNGQGLDQVRGIATSLPCLDASKLPEMPSLHLLFLHGTELTGAVNGLEGFKLRWLKWRECPSEMVAERLCKPSLAVLQLHFRTGCVRQFPSSAATAMLENLRDLEIGIVEAASFDFDRYTNWSACMSQIPVSRESLLSVRLWGLASTTNLLSSLGELKRLEALCMRGWPEGLPNCGQLSGLRLLNISFCQELVDLGSTSITELPSSFGKLNRHRNLNIHDCKQLKELPEDFGYLGSLEKLYLSWSSITKLPSSFGKLKRLRKLNIHDCMQLKELPEDFGSLESLEELDLGRTSIMELPASFGKLKRLRNLYVQVCKQLKKLPEDFGSLGNLQELDLGGTSITKLPSAFGKLKRLRNVNVQDCKQLKELPEDFGSLESLEELNLGGTSITKLPSSFGKLKRLRNVNVQDCKQLKELPEDFGSLKSLQEFDLGGTSITELPASFGKLKTLRNLYFNSELRRLRNFFNSELPSFCGKLKKLKKLPSFCGKLKKLWYLTIVCELLKELLEALGSLESLEELDLSETSISEPPSFFGKLNRLQNLIVQARKQLKELPEDFGLLESLEKLDLGGTSITQSVGKLKRLWNVNVQDCKQLKKLPEDFGSLEILQKLDLGGTSITELPSSFGKLKRLWNFRDCQQLKELPEDFGSLESLEELNLSCTSITELPSSLGKLKRLRSLNVRDCRQLKELPEDFGSLESLEEFNLRWTSITELPSSFGKLKRLWNLNIRDCQQLKELPEDFGSLEGLLALNLRWTSITKLPSSFGKLKRLRNLNARDCQQLKELPEDFGSLESLLELNLRWTSITKLPSSFGELKRLRKLNIRDCQQLKDLPEDFGSFESLEELNLRWTSITELPSSFGKLKRLRTLNVRDCQQLKKLPEDFGSLESLEELDLGGTSVTELPSSFGKLKRLRNVNVQACQQLKELPEDFGSLESLEGLDFGGPSITELPSSFGKLKTLRNLNVRDCKQLFQKILALLKVWKS